MPRSAICTIITPDYADYALALRSSLDESGWTGPLFVLATAPCAIPHPGIRLWTVPGLAATSPGARATLATHGKDRDRLRWCMKPVFLAHLLEEGMADAVVYCDPDLFFFESPQPLFDELRTGGILLTPHWRPATPEASPQDFRLNFTDGLFNAGCVGANRAGTDALRWWAAACRHACEKNPAEGLFDDQRYLDLMPLHFPRTRILRHQGFNLAVWNRHLRDPGEDGVRPVPDRFPVSLVHFTRKTMSLIDQGHDPILEPYLARYRAALDRVRATRRVPA
ncbi:hypothetical protein [Azospirillum sp. sgz302134]